MDGETLKETVLRSFSRFDIPSGQAWDCAFALAASIVVVANNEIAPFMLSLLTHTNLRSTVNYTGLGFNRGQY
jgi:hypothetical protein